MSGINGDKSRFHRERKQKLARRIRNRELFKNVAVEGKTAAPAATPKASKKTAQKLEPAL
jgi:hypothetical protein